MNDTTTIGDVVRVRRHELGWSQTVLAEKVGVSQRTISRVEHNKFVDALRSDLLVRLADALGLRYEDLSIAAGFVSTRKAARAMLALAKIDQRDRDRLIEIRGRLEPQLVKLSGDEIEWLIRTVEMMAKGADTRRENPAPPDAPGSSSPETTPPPADSTSPSPEQNGQ